MVIMYTILALSGRLHISKLHFLTTCLNLFTATLVFSFLNLPLNAQVSLVDQKSFSSEAVRLRFGVDILAFPEGALATDVFSKWGITFRGTDSTVPTIKSTLACPPCVGPPPTYIFSLLNAGRPNQGRPLIVDFKSPVRRAGFTLFRLIRFDQAVPTRLTAFSPGGQLLGTVEVPKLDAFAGIETPVSAGIAKIVIDYDSDLLGEEVWDFTFEYVSGPPKFATYVAQIGDGVLGSDSVLGMQILRTAITVINASNIAANLTLAFFDSNGNPLSLEIDGERSSSHSFSLAASGTRAFVTSGTSSPARAGYARIESSAPVEAIAVFTTSNSRGDIAAEAGVGSSASVIRAVGAVERRLDVSLDSGLALVNSSDRENKVAIILFSEDRTLFAQRSVTLGPREHRARFLTEMFQFLPPNFRGSVEISSPGPVASVILRTRRGLAVTSLPVGSMER
jgi:hypothetical protein